MTESERKKFVLKHCNFCGSKIPDGIVEEFVGNGIQEIFCESCGIDLVEQNEERLDCGEKSEKRIGTIENKVRVTSKLWSKIQAKIKEINNSIFAEMFFDAGEYFTAITK